MPDWFFTSDLHGHSGLYEQLMALAATRSPRAVIIGGDLGPHSPGTDGLRRQRVFLEGFLVEFARRLKEGVPGIELLLLMGNDDWRANHDCLEQHDGALWQVLHERAVQVDGVQVAGMSWVPITPFAMKDWERWEDGGAEAPARLDGYVSERDGLAPHRFDPAHRSPTIAEALERLAEATAVRETVMVLHSPPRDTNCDVTGGGMHVGSRAIRRFVETHAPPLVLSGHIHESPRMTGGWRDAIGESIVVNPGQFGGSRLSGVWFDPKRIGATLRHTLH